MTNEEMSNEKTGEQVSNVSQPAPQTNKTHLVQSKFRTDFDFTMIGTFALCPRKYNLRFNQGRVLKTPQTAPEFGKGIHAGLDSWYMTHDIDKAISVFKETFTEQLDVDSKRSHALGEWMIRNYAQTYGNQPWKLISSEKEFTLAFGEDVNFIGRIDKIIEWNNSLWVVDHKTTSGIGPSSTKMAEPNAQFTGYVWAARKLGHAVCGIILDMLSTAQGLLSASSRSRLTPLLRYDSYRSDDMLKEWEEEFTRNIAHLRDCELSGQWPASGMFNGACVYYGECPFRKVCCEDREHREKYLALDYDIDFWDRRGTEKDG